MDCAGTIPYSGIVVTAVDSATGDITVDASTLMSNYMIYLVVTT